MANQWRKKCDEGCTCGKHQARPCVPGCSCSRHDAPWKRRKCVEGCTCARHRAKRCEPGCTCSRHRPAHNRHTDEQRAEALEARRAKQREYMRAKRREDPEKFRAERQRTRAEQRGYSLKHRHGITVEQWDGIFESQESCCYLCGDPLVKGSIHLDHDHACCPGKKSCGTCIRGLACQKCNQGIGQFGDDPDRMRRVAANLEMANRRLRRQRVTTDAPSPLPAPASAGSSAPAGVISAEAINPH